MPSQKVDITLLFVGPSQAGKSSSTNLLGAKNSVGYNGLSQTKQVGKVITEKCLLYPGKTVMIIDTIGFYDTDLKTSDEIFIRGGQVDFQTVFITKEDGKEIVLYNPSDNQKERQLEELGQAICKTQPFDLRKEFEEYDKDIERRIQELKKTMRIKTEIDVTVQKVKLHIETRTQPYTVEIPYVETDYFLGFIPFGTNSGSNTVQKSFNYEITVPEIYSEIEKQKYEIEYDQEFYRQEAIKQFSEQKRKEIQAKQQYQ